MEELAEKAESNKFEVSFIVSNFSSYYKELFKRIAADKGYTGKIYHPMIRLAFQDKYLYFDWLMEGFSIRDEPRFGVEEIKHKVECSIIINTLLST